MALGASLELWALSSVAWLPGQDIPRYVTLFCGAWLCYAVAIRVVLALPGSGLVGDLALTFLVCVLIRGTLLLTPPTLSDDVFRSVWDARVLSSGVNPYAFPPSASELAPLRDDQIWPRVNAKEQRTPYPPLAEAIGAAAYAALPERTLAFQALAAGMDVLGAALLAWFLRRVGEDPRRALVLAWSPAGAVHFAHSGHNDSIMVVGMIGAVLLLTFGRRWAAMAALAGATMVKAVPALAVPSFARLTGWRGAVPWALTCALFAAPFLGAGPAVLSGLLEEGSEAQFNDSIHWLVGRAGSEVSGASVGPAAGVVSVLPLLLAVGALATRATTPLAVLIASCRALGGYVLVAAVVQPWYVTWIAPLVAVTIRSGRGPMPFALTDGLGWLWFGGAVALSELTYGQESAPWPVIRAVEYLPLYGILSASLIVWLRSRGKK